MDNKNIKTKMENNETKMENNETKMENNETINKKKDIVNTIFCLPITYVDKDKLHEIDHHVMTDLELIHVQSDLEKEK